MEIDISGENANKPQFRDICVSYIQWILHGFLDLCKSGGSDLETLNVYAVSDCDAGKRCDFL